MQERMEKIFSLSLGVLLALSMIYVAHSAAVFVSGRNVEGEKDGDSSGQQVCVVVDAGHGIISPEIGRASCRERVWTYV